MSSVSPLLQLRQHNSGFPAVSSPCVLLWKWRRAYNEALERPLVSSGWTRRTENLRKKCKLRSDAKHGSRGDLARELCGGFFWCSPEKLPVGVVVYQRSTLRDLDAVRTNGELIFEGGHLNASPAQVFFFFSFFLWEKRRLRATARRVREAESSETDLWNWRSLLITGAFWACPLSQSSPEDGSVFIGWDVTFGPMAHFQFNMKGLRYFHPLSPLAVNVSVEGL